MQYNQNQNPNMNNQMYYIRPKTPKLKNNALTIILKVVLFCTIFFSLVFTDLQSYNTMFFYKISTDSTDYFTELLGGANMLEALGIFQNNMVMISYKIITPLIMTLIFFLLYHLYAKFFAYLLFNQMLVLGNTFDIKKFRICLDSSFIFLTLALGIAEFIFYLNPIAYNIGRALVNVFLAVLAMALFFLLYTRKTEKKLYPIIFHIMMIPAITLLLFV